MASLPSLEAVAKELEDLIKPGGPVEVAELTQAGVLRETRETAAAEAISIAQIQLSSYSVRKSTPSCSDLPFSQEIAARYKASGTWLTCTGSGVQAIIPIPTITCPPSSGSSCGSPTHRQRRA